MVNSPAFDKDMRRSNDPIVCSCACIVHRRSRTWGQVPLWLRVQLGPTHEFNERRRQPRSHQVGYHSEKLAISIRE